MLCSSALAYLAKGRTSTELIFSVARKVCEIPRGNTAEKIVWCAVFLSTCMRVENAQLRLRSG